MINVYLRMNSSCLYLVYANKYALDKASNESGVDDVG
jgi:hypothetical protein